VGRIKTRNLSEDDTRNLTGVLSKCKNERLFCQAPLQRASILLHTATGMSSRKIGVQEKRRLYGLSISLKDIMSSKGISKFLLGAKIRTFETCLRKINQVYQSGSDSSAVGTLRAAGALIFGS
jgi:Asp-tRNA(Asn)/Glu-tRNA(Gln) amidotransferase A subunit family amidase